MVHSLTKFISDTSDVPKGERDGAPEVTRFRAQACDAIRPVLPVATNRQSAYMHQDKH
ncbi:MAG: hypothetical protein U0451_02065 [Candidatus Saccharimonadales bacterium]